MDWSDPIRLAEDLRERIAQGDLTFRKVEVKKMAEMLEHLGYRMGEAYQKFGQLADFADRSDHPGVVRAMDLLAWPMRRGQFLSLYTPWTPKAARKTGRAKAKAPAKPAPKKGRRRS